MLFFYISIVHENYGIVNRKRAKKQENFSTRGEDFVVYKKFITFFKIPLDTRARVWYNSRAWQSRLWSRRLLKFRIWAAGSSGGAVSDFKLDETELSWCKAQIFTSQRTFLTDCAPRRLLFGRLDQLALIRFLCPNHETHGAVFGFSSPKSWFG